MKNSEIFYFDVDGTLLDNKDHSIPQSTLESLSALKDKGYKIALCTGRSYLGIIEANVHELFEWDAYVLANGSLVLDKEHNKLFESEFDHALIKEIDDAVSGPLILEGSETFITKPQNDRLREAIIHFGIDSNYEIKKHTNELVYNLICYNFDEITEPLLSKLKKECLMMHDQLGNMEIIPGNSGKHFGTQIVNKHFGFTRYTGFGDGENDVDFLKNATHSVAMGNGVDNVKKVSSFTTKTVEENGIHFALKHFGVL